MDAWIHHQIATAEGTLTWEQTTDARPVYRDPRLRGEPITLARFREVRLLHGIVGLGRRDN